MQDTWWWRDFSFSKGKEDLKSLVTDEPGLPAVAVCSLGGGPCSKVYMWAIGSAGSWVYMWAMGSAGSWANSSQLQWRKSKCLVCCEHFAGLPRISAAGGSWNRKLPVRLYVLDPRGRYELNTTLPFISTSFYLISKSAMALSGIFHWELYIIHLTTPDSQQVQ